MPRLGERSTSQRFLQQVDMGQFVRAGAPINLTGSGAISAAPGSLVGFYVNSTSSGVINFLDGGASGTTVTGSITPAIGFHPLPAYFTTSCYMTLVSGSINVTAFFAVG